METDECGAPEFFSNGTKILHIHGAERQAGPCSSGTGHHPAQDIHYPKPRVLSLTQATELGTVYTRGRDQRCRQNLPGRHGLRVQMDGARFANAVASLG